MSSIPSGYRQVRTPQKTPEQINYLNNLLGQASKYGPDAAASLGKFASGDDQAYAQMQQPAIDTFNQQLIPGLAERFANNGSLSSSSFQNAAAGAAGNLSNQLAAQRAQFQMDAIKSLLGLGNDLLSQQPYQYGLQKKRNTWDSVKDYIDFSSGIASKFLPFAGGTAGF